MTSTSDKESLVILFSSITLSMAIGILLGAWLTQRSFNNPVDFTFGDVIKSDGGNELIYTGLKDAKHLYGYEELMLQYSSDKDIKLFMGYPSSALINWHDAETGAMKHWEKIGVWDFQKKAMKK